MMIGGGSEWEGKAAAGDGELRWRAIIDRGQKKDEGTDNRKARHYLLMWVINKKFALQNKEGANYQKEDGLHI